MFRTSIMFACEISATYSIYKPTVNQFKKLANHMQVMNAGQYSQLSTVHRFALICKYNNRIYLSGCMLNGDRN